MLFKKKIRAHLLHHIFLFLNKLQFDVDLLPLTQYVQLFSSIHMIIEWIEENKCELVLR